MSPWKRLRSSLGLVPDDDDDDDDDDVTATECHLPYGITQCYLLPDTSERCPPLPQPVRPVLDLPTLEG